MSSSTNVQEPEVAREQVLSHLEEVLANRRFASSERNAMFLRYVVQGALDGKADEIKETVIAAEVYRRAGDYDPKTDSIVRVEATRLRQKLRSFYENEGQSSPIRIHLPSGTYVPRFEVVQVEPPPTVPPPPPLQPDPPPEPSRRRWPAIAAAVLCVASIGLAAVSRIGAPANTEAIAAWQEGVALLQQDPHVAQTERGAPPTLIRALERLEVAVARDPNFAPAWATLAEAYDYVFPYVGRDQAEDARRAETAARRSIALDPNLAAGHHMLGLVQFMLRWDFAGAETSYKRTLELDPNNVYAVVEYVDLLRETGRTQAAADLIRKTRALLPGLPQLAVKEAEVHLDLGRPEAAIAAANSALQIKRNYLRAYVVLGAAEEMKGNFASAIAKYEHVLSVNPIDRRALPAYGYALARVGRKDEARAVAQQLEQMNATVRNCAFQVAVVYMGLGEQDSTLDWLERAWSTRQVHFPFAVVEQRFSDLRKHSRFKALVAKVGLNPPA